MTDKTMDDEARAKVLASAGLTEEEVEAGARFEVRADETDPRFEVIMIRQPRMRPRDNYVLSGVDAQWRAMSYHLASAAGVLSMLAGSLPLKMVQELGIPIAAQIVAAAGEIVMRMDMQRKDGASQGDA